jgi:hypothetical protein
MNYLVNFTYRMPSKFLELNVYFVKLAEEFWLEQEDSPERFGLALTGRGISTKLIQTDMPNAFLSDSLTLT